MFQKDSKCNKGTAIDIQYYYYRSIMYSCSCTAACTAVLNLVLEYAYPGTAILNLVHVPTAVLQL